MRFNNLSWLFVAILGMSGCAKTPTPVPCAANDGPVTETTLPSKGEFPSLERIAHKQGLAYLIRCHRAKCTGWLQPKDEESIYPAHQVIVEGDSPQDVANKLIAASKSPLPETPDALTFESSGGDK